MNSVRTRCGVSARRSPPSRLSGLFWAGPERSRNANATPTSVSAAVITISWSSAATNTCGWVCW